MRHHLIAYTVIATMAASSVVSSAHDQPISAAKLVIVDKSGANGTTSLQFAAKSSGIHAATAAPMDLSADLEIFYADVPATRGSFPMPAPWQVVSETIAKFRNLQAPAGSSVVKSAVLKPSRALTIKAKGLGGLDVSSAPGANGIIVRFLIANGHDGSTHQMCTQFSAALGSDIRYAEITRGAGRKLRLRNGVGVSCHCFDGVLDADETDVDCGGSCARCSDGSGCSVGTDCDSEVCSGGTCQAASCDDGVQNGAETGLDCGGTCAQCPLSCSPEALDLIDLLNDYRAQHGKLAISAAPSLCFVADTHAVDLWTNSPDAPAGCNLHSWSDQGPWTPCCYTPDHAQAACMWDKPGELTDYGGAGFEVAAYGASDAASALALWKSSPPHDDVLLNEGGWTGTWRAVGPGPGAPSAPASSGATP